MPIHHFVFNIPSPSLRKRKLAFTRQLLCPRTMRYLQSVRKLFREYIPDFPELDAGLRKYAKKGARFKEYEKDDEVLYRD